MLNVVSKPGFDIEAVDEEAAAIVRIDYLSGGKLGLTKAGRSFGAIDRGFEVLVVPLLCAKTGRVLGQSVFSD